MKPKYLFLIIGMVILVVVAISWFAFDWRHTPGGVWLLVGGDCGSILSSRKHNRNRQ